MNDLLSELKQLDTIIQSKLVQHYTIGEIPIEAVIRRNEIIKEIREQSDPDETPKFHAVVKESGPCVECNFSDNKAYPCKVCKGGKYFTPKEVVK